MNKTKIKNFSIWARRNLIDAVAYHMRLLGIDEKGIRPEMEGSSDKLKLYDMGTSKPAEVADKDISKRDHLARHIQDHQKKSDYKTAYETVVEEIAYTWFNRLIAIRFMEVNDYLPSGVRVLSSTSGKPEPDIVTQAEEVASGQGFTISTEEIWKLKDENKLDELFRILFIAQCRKLHEILPELFDNSQSDFTELLLPISFIDNDGFIRRLITDIDEDDFMITKNGQVEIIGWLYQYYISEKHNEVINVHTKQPIKKEDLPAATQIFTTEWVVKYMVDNSLGKYWINHQDNLIEGLDFFIPTQEETSINNRIPTNIKFLDPCMGSGHILVYAFDVLMKIYLSCGYTERSAAQNIVEYNLWGLDLDKRAYQLAYFAVMMKARQYDRRFLGRGITPNLSYFQDLPVVNYNMLDEPIRSFVSQFEHADTYGSLLCVNRINDIEKLLDEYTEKIWFSIPHLEHHRLLYKILSQKYEIVCTNPPYHNKYDSKLEEFINEYYSIAKGDLYAAFIIRNFSLCTSDGFVSMMTPHGWMFTKSYEKLRERIISEKSISTLVHMAKGAFYSEATVDICSFVLRNGNNNLPGRYVRLEKFKGDMEVQKNKVIDAINSDECSYIYECTTDRFHRIEGIPFSYWATEKTYSFFEKGIPLSKISPPRQGMATTNNNKFLRLWYEVQFEKIGFGMKSEDESAKSRKKFFPYNKGGEHRKWYGNNYYVVNFYNHGKELCDYIDVACAPKFNHKNR